MKRKLVLVFAILALLTLTTPASAITYGEPDNGQHPYVGLAVFYSKGVPQWRCSGTLLSPTVFLTAGHCVYDTSVNIDSAQVWFEEHVTTASGYPYSGGIKGQPIRNPGWTGLLTIPATHDNGVILLSKKVTDKGYAKLPALGFLDSLATQRGQQSITFTVVGYGLQEVRPNPSSLRDRMKATSKLVDLGSALTGGYGIHTSNNPGNGSDTGSTSGGTCFGDSGGPVFYGGFDSNLIIATTSWGFNANCKGSDFAYRTDIADTQNFLAQFGVTP